MPPPSIRIVLESRVLWLEPVQAIAEDLGAAMGLDEDDRFAVGMALREALNNAMLHGNRKDTSKLVEVTLLAHPDRLEMRIKDEGPGFDSRNLPDPLAEQNLLKSSGRGVFLIKNYMDEVDLDLTGRPGGEVRMVKYRKVASPVEGSAPEGALSKQGSTPG